MRRPFRRSLAGFSARWLAPQVVALLLAATSFAAQPDSKGTDFWLMFPQNYSGGSELSLFITGDVAASGTAAVPGIGFTTPFSVVPGTVTTVVVPPGAQASVSDVIQNLGIHVTSDQEVTVYGLNRIQYTTDAYLGLPTDILGTEYINQGYQNVNVVNGTLFGVVATQDATTVTITPTVTTGARVAGVPYSILMNQGQTYQLINGDSYPADLSGSIIQSDKPIGVFGGHQCANIPQGFVACDHIVEQLPPTSTWGTAFVTEPLATRLAGDTWRILASQDATSVSINGVPVATLARGQFHETVLTGASVINSDKPVLVTQYSNSSSFDNVTSDPFEVVVPPFEQFLASYTITTPATGFSTNFVNVVAPTATVGSVLLDGIPIPAGSFSPIGASGFSGAQVPIVLGNHSLSGPLPFGITTYGFADYDSYGYPGGLALAEVAELASLVVTPESATNPVGTEHCVVGTTLDQNADPLPGIRVDFEVTGVNPSSGFAFGDAAGEATFCYTGTNPGTDTITGSVGALSDAVTKIWTEEAPERCDVDGDADIDYDDVSAIFAARGSVASGPDDPRDADGNGIINVNDGRICALVCTEEACKSISPPPACGLFGIEPFALVGWAAWRRRWRRGSR